jgi:hypothetical protein
VSWSNGSAIRKMIDQKVDICEINIHVVVNVAVTIESVDAEQEVADSGDIGNV